MVQHSITVKPRDERVYFFKLRAVFFIYPNICLYSPCDRFAQKKGNVWKIKLYTWLNQWPSRNKLMSEKPTVKTLNVSYIHGEERNTFHIREINIFLKIYHFVYTASKGCSPYGDQRLEFIVKPHFYLPLHHFFYNLAIWFQFTLWSSASMRRKTTKHLDQTDIFLKWQIGPKDSWICDHGSRWWNF